jgi:membrane dipeptidase
MIRSVAEHGGVIGVNFYGQFLTEGNPKEADIEDVLRHVNHLVNVGGIDCVALGSDFDGMDAPPIGLENSSRLPSLFEELEKAGYKHSEIEKISCNNAYRVIKEVCS